jgi:hypothetical protein
MFMSRTQLLSILFVTESNIFLYPFAPVLPFNSSSRFSWMYPDYRVYISTILHPLGVYTGQYDALFLIRLQPSDYFVPFTNLKSQLVSLNLECVELVGPFQTLPTVRHLTMRGYNSHYIHALLQHCPGSLTTHSGYTKQGYRRSQNFVFNNSFV